MGSTKKYCGKPTKRKGKMSHDMLIFPICLLLLYTLKQEKSRNKKLYRNQNELNFVYLLKCEGWIMGAWENYFLNCISSLCKKAGKIYIQF